MKPPEVVHDEPESIFAQSVHDISQDSLKFDATNIENPVQRDPEYDHYSIFFPNNILFNSSANVRAGI